MAKLAGRVTIFAAAWLAGCIGGVKTWTDPVAVEVIKVNTVRRDHLGRPSLCAALVRMDGQDASMKNAPLEWCDQKPKKALQADLVTMSGNGLIRVALMFGEEGGYVEFQESKRLAREEAE